MKITNFKILLLLLVGAPGFGQVDTVGVFGFGHSLLDHTTSNETTVFHWMNDIAIASGRTFSAGGKFGQLPAQALSLPPFAQWFYANVPSVWDSNTEAFGASDINTILVTAANFIQYLPPDDPADSNGDPTITEATEIIFDWVNGEESDMRYYIYLNWPEMDLQNNYPPTPPLQSEVDDFYADTESGSFPNWWTTYQDLMMVSRPQYNTRLIPVGPIISEILSTILPTQIPFVDLYEDAAPHGRATIYFLAGMITYMAIFEENIPSSYLPSAGVEQSIHDNMAAIRTFAWNELNNYNFPNGDSRVFYGAPLPIKFVDFSGERIKNAVELSWTTAIEVDNFGFDVEHSFDAKLWNKIGFVNGKGTSSSIMNYDFVHDDVTGNRISYYRLKQIDIDNTFNYSSVIRIDRQHLMDIQLTPNPASSFLSIIGGDNELATIAFFDIYGRKVNEQIVLNKEIDISGLMNGIYMVKVSIGEQVVVKKILKED